jgi:hypothetical protein
VIPVFLYVLVNSPLFFSEIRFFGIQIALSSFFIPPRVDRLSSLFPHPQLFSRFIMSAPHIRVFDSSNNLASLAPLTPVFGSQAQSPPQTLVDMKIFSGTANEQLASEIADSLGIKIGSVSIKGYADGEIGIQIQESVRGQDCYIVQPTWYVV